MESGKQNKLDKLKALQDSYGRELPQRIDALQVVCQQLQHALEQPRMLQELHRLVHSLAGSAGTFGYTELSDQARRIELDLTAWLQLRHVPAAGQLAALAERIADLRQASLRAAPVQAAAMTLYPVEADDNRLVFVIEDDLLLGQEIQAQLAIYGWQVEVFTALAQARQALAHRRPAVLVVDIMLPEGASAGTDFMVELNRQTAEPVPVIIMSARWDWPSRLGAARAGAQAYLTKPIDFTILAERMDQLTQRSQGAPYQVLVVEDNTLLASHYAAVLEHAGMKVVALADPSRILDVLDDFSPELILLDLYMPQCNGIEVARVIRQDSKFIDLPIVFLSTESGRQFQLAALQTGADDFLHKPISDKDLVTAVRQRSERFRSLRELIRQDRMTGLLNHISFKLQLEFELARQQRQGSLLNLVMLDIDHFKKVNDSYGHPVGDRVIKSLARLLSKRLRKTDIVGRYGGEEFGVIMPDTHAHDALRVMDQLRHEFTQIIHVSHNTEFACSFSAGIVAAQDDYSLDNLFQYADEALYQSKQKGRNCVTLYHC